MKLTEERKKYIDSLPYEVLLSKWRFAYVGNELLQGETGKYWGERMAELRSRPGGLDLHIRSSKDIGRDR